MPKDYSININDFSGIFRAMAEKANVNGDAVLKGAEISLFNEIKSTHNTKNSTFIFGNTFYNESGNEVELTLNRAETAISTRVAKQPIFAEIENETKNNSAIKKAEKYKNQENKYKNKTIIVNKTVNGKKVKFSFNRSSIENYIINDSVDSNGNKITIFSDIPEIRKKPFRMRTKEDCKKLVDFNNMVNSAINAGVEYGVDPKLIVAIMQREVGFDGLNERVVGVNGKGYMQLTSAPVKDMLGGYTKNNTLCFEEHLKTEQYGPELETLLKSRGFKINCPPEKRDKLVSDIMQYLKLNKDCDFNIRLGTLVLRYYLNKSNGNIQTAAQNYNGHPSHKIAYGKAVKNFYNKMDIKQKHQTIT